MKRAWLPALVAVAGVLHVAGLLRADTGGAVPPSALPADPALSLAALDRKIADLDTQEKADKEELSHLAGDVATRHARVVAHGRELYKLTRAGLLPLGSGFGALVTHAMHVERARRMVIADVQTETRLRGRAASLALELERVARDRVTLGTQRSAADAARAAMLDEQRRQVAFDKAFQTSTGAAGDYVAVYGGNGTGAAAGDSGGFAEARGRLLFPVLGRAEVRPAHRDGIDGPGVEIRAPGGSVVRAAFAGRVSFADRYGAYGRIVILDHGDHYYTVSGNLDEIDVKIGADVGAGERIGTVGDDGRGSMLYFEVRHGSQAVQPGPWLGL
jgi:murein DD-endopeptidase MepM/ murein hydrolase activator NlpD